MRKGEVLKHIAPPFPASRDAWFYDKHNADAIRIGGVPASMVLRSQKEAVTLQGFSVGGNGMPLSALLRNVADADPHEITGDRVLLETFIPGDFVFSSSASKDQVVKRLTAVLNDELSIDIQIRSVPNEQEVYVMRGEYKPSPTEKKPRRIEVSGQFQEFIDCLSGWIEHPIISEVQQPPASEIHWYAQLEDVWAIERENKAESVEQLLEHITRQTGLSFTKEMREASVWRVELSEE
jgi:hypothetical protein